MSDDDVRRALAELGREELPEAALAEVRQRVLVEIATPRRAAAPVWRWAAAAGLALALIGGGVWRGLPSRGGSDVNVEVRTEVAPPVITESARAPAPSRPLRPIQRRSANPVVREKLPAGRPQPLLIKLVTDDPDVVIYWIVESKGESE